jgi:hypothetical protein
MIKYGYPALLQMSNLYLFFAFWVIEEYGEVYKDNKFSSLPTEI